MAFVALHPTRGLRSLAPEAFLIIEILERSNPIQFPFEGTVFIGFAQYVRIRLLCQAQAYLSFFFMQV